MGLPPYYRQIRTGRLSSARCSDEVQLTGGSKGLIAPAHCGQQLVLWWLGLVEARLISGCCSCRLCGNASRRGTGSAARRGALSAGPAAPAPYQLWGHRLVRTHFDPDGPASPSNRRAPGRGDVQQLPSRKPSPTSAATAAVPVHASPESLSSRLRLPTARGGPPSLLPASARTAVRPILSRRPDHSVRACWIKRGFGGIAAQTFRASEIDLPRHYYSSA